MKLLLILYHLVTQITVIYAANQYLGCFIDQIGNRDLSIFIDDYEQLTPKQCILACQAQNYLYAAIQYGNECRCGQQYGKYGQVSDEQCDYLCSTAEKCGGDNRNSVYNVVSTIEQLSTDASLLSEKLIRVKRAVATNDSTQTTNSHSISTHLSNSTSENTVSHTMITSQPLITASSSMPISSSIHSMTSTSHTISSIPSSTQNTSTAVHSSFMMSSMASSTHISSTNTREITIPTSLLSTSTIPKLANTSILTTIISNRTSSVRVSQSSTNLVTNTMNLTESSSMYSITSLPSISSSFHTYTSEAKRNTVTAVSNPTSSHTSTSQSIITSSYTIQSTSTMTSIPTSSRSVSTGSISLNPMSSSNIVYNNPSNFSSMITTEITSTYSNQITGTMSEQNSSISSVPNLLILPTNLLANNSTNIDVQTTINSFLYADITVQTSVTAQTVNSTVSTVQTTAVPSAYVISTIIIIPSGQSFNPNDNTTQQTIITRLSAIITLAFQCLSNPSYPNCTVTRQRVKRQLCSSGYNVQLISITPTSTTNEYLIQYTVTNPCSQNALVSPAQVQTATATLSQTLIMHMLGYAYDGAFVRSATIGPTNNPTSDPKLWLIGATLGPVAFALLLICAFCYLHYKCRPRPTNRTSAKAIPTAPTKSARGSNHQILANEPIKEKPIVEKDLHALAHSDPLVGATPPLRRLTPIQSERRPSDATEYSVSNEIPLAEIRRQNDVERWRNKLRLQEKFQQSSVPNTNRSESYQYDNRTFEHDPSSINIQPVNDIVSKYSPQPTPKSTEIQVGRTKLHRLLDDVLDKADSDDAYNPDSDVERQKRRRQRRLNQSISNDQNTLLSNPQIPHIPVIPQVYERPDPSLVRLRYNPYEAGDRAHDISRLTPVELKPKYTTDDQRSTQYSSRSNPPLFYNDSTIVDRAATATNAYASPKRFGKTRLETDREAVMRHDGGRIDQRQHKFNDDAVHIDTIPRDRDAYRVQARTVWVEPDIDDDSLGKNDYNMAKRSVANTRNIISSIHDELRNIAGSTSSGDYHA